MIMRKSKDRGFTLIELAIVLGVVGIVAAGLFRLFSTGNQQTKDQATAQQQLALINAVKGYLADTSTGGGQAFMTTLAANTAANIPLPTSNTSVANCQANIGASYKNLCNYLTPGFYSATTNPYNQTYVIQVLKDGSAAGTAPSSYSFMIVTSGGTTIPDTDGGSISGLIGGDGGFIYTSTAVCGATAPTACGALGAWTVTNIKSLGTATPQGYGYASATAGTVASRSFVTPSTNNSNFWLARVPIAGDSTYLYNAMTTNLFMGNYVAATDAPLNTVPSIYLHGGAIQANGTTSAVDANGQIDLNYQTQALADASGVASLIYLTTHCNQATDASCPYAIDISQGDIGVGGVVTATKIYSASDARLKTGIHPIEGALSHLMKIDPVAFSFKAGGSPSMGVTAQNLEKTYPELVKESNGTKFVEYSGLIGPLIGAVQELKRQNDDLREQLHRQDLREQHLEDELRAKTAAP